MACVGEFHHGGFLMQNAHQIERHFHKGNPLHCRRTIHKIPIWIERGESTITAEGLVILQSNGKVILVIRDKIKLLPP
jgi:hypothetical protein